MTEDGQEFDIGDEGSMEDETYKKIQYEELILSILNSLDDREKEIFMYQILRSDGYRVDHEACARTLHITRGWYMIYLRRVKQKAAMIVKEHKKGVQSP